MSQPGGKHLPQDGGTVRTALRSGGLGYKIIKRRTLESVGSEDQREACTSSERGGGLEGEASLKEVKKKKNKQWKLKVSQKQGSHTTGRNTTFLGTKK